MKLQGMKALKNYDAILIKTSCFIFAKILKRKGLLRRGKGLFREPQKENKNIICKGM